MFTVNHQINLSNLIPVAVGAAIGVAAFELWKWGRQEQSKKVLSGLSAGKFRSCAKNVSPGLEIII